MIPAVPPLSSSSPVDILFQPTFPLLFDFLPRVIFVRAALYFHHHANIIPSKRASLFLTRSDFRFDIARRIEANFRSTNQNSPSSPFTQLLHSHDSPWLVLPRLRKHQALRHRRSSLASHRPSLVPPRLRKRRRLTRSSRPHPRRRRRRRNSADCTTDCTRMPRRRWVPQVRARGEAGSRRTSFCSKPESDDFLALDDYPE